MLLGNYSVLHKSPLRFFGGSTTSVEPQLPSNFNKSGSSRNSLYTSGATAALVTYSMPSGNNGGRTWLLPQKSGEMTSHNDCVVTISSAAGILGGITTTGSSQITFTLPDMAGELISSGSGTASFTFSTGAALVASLDGGGSASFSLQANTPELGAEANIAASSTFTFTGTLSPYAVGFMLGSTVDTTVLTVDAIAAGLLAAASASPIAADVRRVNAYSVGGDGQPGSEWGPA